MSNTLSNIKSTNSNQAGKKPAAKAYHLTPAAEAPLLELADRMHVKPDALVDLAVRQFAARMTTPGEPDAWTK